MQHKSTLNLFLLSCILIFIHCKKEPVEPPKSSDATISKLELEADGISYSTSINASEIKLNEKLPVGITEVSIKTLSLSANAMANKKEGDVLKFDESPISIVITAEDGSSKQYSLVLEQVTKPSINFVSSLDAVSPYQVVTLSADNYVFTEEQYQGKIGDEDILLGKTNEGNLVFVMPELAVAKHAFSITVEGFLFEPLEFDLLAMEALTQSPDMIFETQLVNPIDSFIDHVESYSRTSGRAVNATNMETLVGLKADYESAISQLSSEEKTQLAHFFEVNKELFGIELTIPEVNDTFSLTRMGDLEVANYLDRQARYFASLVITTGLTIDIFVGLIYLPDPSGWTKVAALATSVVLAGEIVALYTIAENIATVPFNHINSVIDDIFRNETIEFDNGKSIQVTFKGTYETASESDVNSSSVLVRTVVENLKKVEGYLNKVKSLFQRAKEIFGISKSEVVQPTSLFNNNSKELSIPEKYLSISNISNNNITSDVNAIANGFEIAIHNSSEQEQSFNFDVIYENEKLGTRTVNTFQGKVGVEIDSTDLYFQSMLGKYLKTPANPEGSKTYCELFEDGRVEYSVYDHPSWPDGRIFKASWKIIKYEGKYYYWESGFWHPAYPSFDKDLPLSYPTGSFKYHNETTYVKQ